MMPIVNYKWLNWCADFRKEINMSLCRNGVEYLLPKKMISKSTKRSKKARVRLEKKYKYSTKYRIILYLCGLNLDLDLNIKVHFNNASFMIKNNNRNLKLLQKIKCSVQCCNQKATLKFQFACSTRITNSLPIKTKKKWKKSKNSRNKTNCITRYKKKRNLVKDKMARFQQW